MKVRNIIVRLCLSEQSFKKEQPMYPSMIELFVEPRVTKTWEQFKEQNPPFSIALDGYVADRPLFDPQGPHVNFNHHEYVDRLSTRSTTGQIHLAIKQGLLQTFNVDGVPAVRAYVNDADYDVCAAWWLLQNHERISGVKSEPLITKLVAITDFQDATGGLYPLDPNTKMMRERAWIFEPYSEARLNGRITVMDAGEMRNVIAAVANRIDDYTLGKAREKNVDTRYERVGGGRGWTMVREIGAEARAKMLADGINAFVSVREAGDEKYAYTLARLSPYIPFPLPELLGHINTIEGYAHGDPYAWGGSNIIGGSSRRNKTKITPRDLEKIINHYLDDVINLTTGK